MMVDTRYLVVNADDFGLTDGVNRGIIQAHEHGIVTSTSLMVRWHGAAQAAEYARANSSLGVGLHVDLGEWAFRGGSWIPLYDVVAFEHAAVRKEVSRQLDRFRQLVSRDPTHLDTHQHVHQREPARTVLTELGRELGVPVRHFAPNVTYRGDFYGQTTEGASLPSSITVEHLLSMLDRIPTGITEFACHPGFIVGTDTMYAAERAEEVKTLCDRRVRERIEERRITLTDFRLTGANSVSTPVDTI